MIVEQVLLSDRLRRNCTGGISLGDSICRGHNDQLDLINGEGKEDVSVEMNEEKKDEREPRR